ncbi:MAG: hypothetical protein Q9204_006902, partial [Flavoplaca sp. TL-2023a]
TIKEEVTLDFALEEEHNMLRRLLYWNKRVTLLGYLLNHAVQIEANVAHHLALRHPSDCSLSPLDDWLHGSFNMCVPVHVKRWEQQAEKRVMIRFPLPYKVGEENFPGNAEEKLRCEAATYIWLQQHCPDVPIPRLLGFSFGDNYCPHPLDHGYLLTDYIEDAHGTMLSETWEQNRGDKTLRTNLFRDLSRIILSIGKVPLPRIGSFTMSDKGVLSLTNRPLTLPLHELENGGIPTNIGKRDTYTAIEPYVLDLLANHENRLRYQPNAINDEFDGRAQMAAITGMRAVLPHLIQRRSRQGPFSLTLTDLHQSNIYVDKNWHIKSVIDLEWACSLPIQMQTPPIWLTSRGIDQFEGEHLTEYEQALEGFMEAFEHEEMRQGHYDFMISNHQSKNAETRTQILRNVWKTGAFFYFSALDSPTGLFNVWVNNIQPKFGGISNLKDGVNKIMAPYWSSDAVDVIAAKLKDREVYTEKLNALFDVGNSKPPPPQ